MADIIQFAPRAGVVPQGTVITEPIHAPILPPRNTGGMSIEDAVPVVLAQHYHSNSVRTQYRVGLIAKAVLKHSAGMSIEAIDTAHLRSFVTACKTRGNVATTINIKLSFYSVLFDHFKTDLRGPYPGMPYVPPQIPWEVKPVLLKWWMTPEMEGKVVSWLRSAGLNDYADYVVWTTHSGLRIEETLRLQRSHFDLASELITVPGTKNAGAQRTLPLMAEAMEIASRRLKDATESDYLFNFSKSDIAGMTVEEIVDRNYLLLRDMWNRIRDVFGLHRTPTATVKALRRTFARYATDRGMPTALLQQYLGHSDIDTTMGYLRLVGGHNLDVMRKWVS